MNEPNRIHLPSLLQFALSGFGLLLTVPLALLLGALGVFSQLMGSQAAGRSIGLLSFASEALLISLLLIPGALLALFTLLGRTPPDWTVRQPYRLATSLLLLWPVLVGLGFLASREPAIAWLFLPVLQVLVIGIPVWWFIETGRRGLPSGGAQKAWGIFDFGLTINPLLILALELIVLIVLGVLAILWVASTQPAFFSELQRLVGQMQTPGANPDEILQMLEPYAQQPGVIVSGFLLVSLVMPALEELFKPLIIWFLAPGRRMTPAEGFVAGLLSGGGFALIESLNLAGNINDLSWAAVVTGRVGTGLLHITTTGLVGWAIVSAFRERRPARLIWTYLIAVALHGLWNLFGVLMGLGTLLPTGPYARAAGLVGQIAPFALVVLAILLFILLTRFNHRLRPEPVEAPGFLSPVQDTTDNGEIH